MTTYIMIKAETRLGVFVHSIVPVDFNNSESMHNQILLFVADLYSDQGYSDFKPEYYYQIDFDKLFDKGQIVVNDNLHISLMYGTGESV